MQRVNTSHGVEMDFWILSLEALVLSYLLAVGKWVYLHFIGNFYQLKDTGVSFYLFIFFPPFFFSTFARLCLAVVAGPSSPFQSPGLEHTQAKCSFNPLLAQPSV